MLFPYLIQATDENFQDFVKKNRDFISHKIIETGALLFRGYELFSAEDFQQAVVSIQPKLLNYIGGDSPRNKINDKIYTSTSYPPEETISMHHEKSFSNIFPRFIYFFCEIEPQIGGETPLADGREVFKKIPPGIIEKFSSRKLKYIMNMNNGEGIGRSWKEVLEVNTTTEAETLLDRLNIKYKWKENGYLQTEEVVNPIIVHPETGEKIFFSQADQWHPSNLKSEVLEAMKEVLQEDDFYHNCRYADDTEIESDDLEAIRAVVRNERVFFKWKKGDFLMVDNLIAMHGRSPFEGERRILVAMS